MKQQTLFFLFPPKVNQQYDHFHKHIQGILFPHQTYAAYTNHIYLCVYVFNTYPVNHTMELLWSIHAT